MAIFNSYVKLPGGKQIPKCASLQLISSLDNTHAALTNAVAKPMPWTSNFGIKPISGKSLGMVNGQPLVGSSILKHTISHIHIPIIMRPYKFPS